MGGNNKRNTKNARDNCYKACGPAPDSKNIKSPADKVAWLKQQSNWLNCQMECVQKYPINSNEKRKAGRKFTSMSNMLRGGRKTRRSRKYQKGGEVVCFRVQTIQEFETRIKQEGAEVRVQVISGGDFVGQIKNTNTATMVQTMNNSAPTLLFKRERGVVEEFNYTINSENIMNIEFCVMAV